MGSAGSNESALSFYLRAPRVGAVPRVCRTVVFVVLVVFK